MKLWLEYSILHKNVSIQTLTLLKCRNAKIVYFLAAFLYYNRTVYWSSWGNDVLIEKLTYDHFWCETTRNSYFWSKYEKFLECILWFQIINSSVQGIYSSIQLRMGLVFLSDFPRPSIIHFQSGKKGEERWKWKLIT